MPNFDTFRNIPEIKHIEYSTILEYHNRITQLPCKATVTVEINVRNIYPDWDGVDWFADKIPACTLEELCGHIHNVLIEEITDAEIKVTCQHITSRGATITVTTFNTHNDNTY